MSEQTEGADGGADGSKKTLVVTQTGSRARKTDRVRQTLLGLGLTRRHRTRRLEDTPAVRGMIKRVHHLVRVDEEQDQG